MAKLSRYYAPSAAVALAAWSVIAPSAAAVVIGTQVVLVRELKSYELRVSALFLREHCFVAPFK